MAHDFPPGGGGGDREGGEAGTAAWLQGSVLGSDLTWRQLLADATAAASSHNTQPWRFRVEPDHHRLVLRPDGVRRCPVVDPDDHHLWASLGCAAENIVVSAAARGLRARVRQVGTGAEARVTVSLLADGEPAPALAAAIGARQCTRSAYDGRPVPSTDLDALANAGASGLGDVILITDPRRMRVVADHVAEGNRRQLGDPAFVEELFAWLRFTRGEAQRTGDGLWSAAAGRPAAPRWLMRPLRRVVLSARGQVARDRAHIASSAGIAVFTSHEDSPAAWVDAGRRYERFALEATVRGIRQAFVNQPVEVPELRRDFARWLGLSRGRVDFVVRFGYGPLLPRSLRRPVEAVLDA